MAVLTQALNDHLVTCEAQGATTNRRLGRIESIMLACTATLVMQLLGVTAYLFIHLYPPAPRAAPAAPAAVLAEP